MTLRGPNGRRSRGWVEPITYAVLLAGIFGAYAVISFSDVPKSGEAFAAFGLGISVSERDSKYVRVAKGPEVTVYSPGNSGFPYWPSTEIKN